MAPKNAPAASMTSSQVINRISSYLIAGDIALNASIARGTQITAEFLHLYRGKIRNRGYGLILCLFQRPAGLMIAACYEGCRVSVATVCFIHIWIPALNRC